MQVHNVKHRITCRAKQAARSTDSHQVGSYELVQTVYTDAWVHVGGV